MASKFTVWFSIFGLLVAGYGMSGEAAVPPDAGAKGVPARITLTQSVIVVDASELSYVQYGTKDLADYLEEITGTKAPIRATLDEAPPSFIVVGKTLAEQVASDVLGGRELGEEGYLIKSLARSGKVYLIVAGATPHGTKFGLAALMKMIQVDGKTPYVEGPVDVASKPALAVRGMHLNGWPINYPYTFRVWKEKDWQRYIDMLAYQGVNLFYIWPFMDIIPVPLSPEDEAYLQEVNRVVDYAQTRHGMEVWIMHSVDRVAQSNLGMSDPRARYYWVYWNQLDLNPADPRQFEAIVKSREALYRIVNKADGFCMIDSDPGGWPYSPLSDEMKVFRAMRELLDRYNVHGKQAKLINWMWTGWGNTEWQGPARQAELMKGTIRAMKRDVPEPWWLISGFKEYLPICQMEGVLERTVFLPYGIIEGEPSFPATNVPLDKVRKNLDILGDFPKLRGLMGNNQCPLLQFPRTYYFLASAWDYDYRNRNQRDVLLEVAGHLYPEHKKLVADCFSAINETDPQKIDGLRAQLGSLINQDKLGRLGVLGRKLFPDRAQVARDLVSQLKVRAAREVMCRTLTPTTSRNESARVIESYLDALLAWTNLNGWEMMVNVNGWGSLIVYDKEFAASMSNLKRALGGGSPVTDDTAIGSFLEPISKKLLLRYGTKNAVMQGCTDAIKKAIREAR
jgi:hypothetical protein